MQEYLSYSKELRMQGDDNLNNHEQCLHILMKDGHYNIIYKDGQQNFDIGKLKNCNPKFNSIMQRSVNIIQDHKPLKKRKKA